MILVDSSIWINHVRFGLSPSARDRLRRSRLYLPGNEPKYFINAGLHGPDGIILDLEDSVHPAEKDAARLLVRNALRAVDFGAVRTHGAHQSISARTPATSKRSCPHPRTSS